MFDFHPPQGILGLLFTIFAYVGAFGILAALVWVNVLIGGLVNAMLMLVTGPMLDKLLKKPMVAGLLAKAGMSDLAA